MSEQRLANIEREQGEILTLLRSLSDKVDERTSASDDWRKKVERTVYGDGNGHLGHNIKLDRLLQTAERQKWLIRTLGAAVIGLAAKAVLQLIGG